MSHDLFRLMGVRQNLALHYNGHIDWLQNLGITCKPLKNERNETKMYRKQRPLPGLEKFCTESCSLNVLKFSSFVKHDRLSILQKIKNQNKNCSPYLNS